MSEHWTDGEPISWQALELLQALLRQIRIANGYRTDIGADVSLDGGQVPDDSQPHVQLFAGDLPVTSEGKRLRNQSMDVFVQAVVPIGGNAELTAHRARADICRCLLDWTRLGVPPGLSSISITDSVIAETMVMENCR